MQPLVNKEDWNWLTGVHKYLLLQTNYSLCFLGFFNFGHFLLKDVKLENSFEPSVIQYVIDLYSEVVIKLFDIGVTNVNHIFGLWDCERKSKFENIFASEKCDLVSHE
jgi:hypothetical protein